MECASIRLSEVQRRPDLFGLLPRQYRATMLDHDGGHAIGRVRGLQKILASAPRRKKGGIERISSSSGVDHLGYLNRWHRLRIPGAA